MAADMSAIFIVVLASKFLDDGLTDAIENQNRCMIGCALHQTSIV
jgi:hypothetical protein